MDEMMAHYDRECCSVAAPCAINEGDCDSDSECQGNLICGSNNCPAPFPSDANCCESPFDMDEMMAHPVPYEIKGTMLNKIDATLSERESTEHFTQSWWWKLGRDLIGVVVKRLLFDNNSLFGGLASDTPQENMDIPQNFAADEMVSIEKPNEKIPSYKWNKKGKRQKKNANKNTNYNKHYRE
jgi:hypothetical protein